MGINDLLPHLPGGGDTEYFHSLFGLGLEDKDVLLDAGGALWQCASTHAWDYMRGNHLPALVEWARFLNFARSVLRWKLAVYMDGMENEHKAPENERRAVRVQKAREKNDARGQVRNTPEYIAKAIKVCRHFSIEVFVSAKEADPQVVYAANLCGGVLITGDSDVFAYGVKKAVIMKSFLIGFGRAIDTEAPVADGEYPLTDLHGKHGTIVFQLYAACRGCDFTTHPSGVDGIGFKTFVELAGKVEGELSAASLAKVIWAEKEEMARKNDFESAAAVEAHLQNIVDVYSRGHVYDGESNIVELCKRGGQNVMVQRATPQSKEHMAGRVNSRTREAHGASVNEALRNLECSQLLSQTAADASTIRGVHLPHGKTPDDCTVSDLRDFCAARGGKIARNKPELVASAKAYQFVEREVKKTYVDRNPDPNGSLYASIDAGKGRDVGDIIRELATSPAMADANDGGIIKEAYQLYNAGLFEDKYDNIATMAPELSEDLIYLSFCHIGSNLTQKNIGNALQRCWYEQKTSYHALALVPGEHRCIMMSKAHASMKVDEKERAKTEEGELPDKQEYLVIEELLYRPTDAHRDGHSLGIFFRLGRSYCSGCVAGQGPCRHRPERLWFQYYHWTEERHDRFGIERPSTMGMCSWAPGGKGLNSGVNQKIYEQQTVKHERSIKDQVAKMERAVKRNCTEGTSADYQVHLSAKKQRTHHPGRFAPERVEKLFRLLRKQS